jgi:small subunit ribosomal protein S6
MMNYESIIILNPTIDEAESEKVSQRMQEVIASNGGEVQKVEKWGKRKLAYTVHKHKKGEYVLFQFTGEAVTVSELERNYRMTDAIIKFMTVRLEKEALAAQQAAALAAEARAAAEAEAAESAANAEAAPEVEEEAEEESPEASEE